jgi:RHS repeat-associated protein
MTDNSGIHNYTYDSIYRIIQATHPTIPTEQFSYDPLGNRLGTTVDAGNRLLEDNNFTYSYDNNGNLVQKTNKTTGEITTYTYDTENRLTQVSYPGMVATYKYDPFGRRIEKNVNGVITRYLYDNEDILFEINGNNNIIAAYVHGPGIDEPIAMTNGQSYYYHTDALGSITAITDSTGNVVQRYEYDSFGNITFIQDPNFIQPYTYTGREYNPESGIYYYRARYYDPKIGRFISEDPIGLLGGINLYSYVGNSSLNYSDPFGLFIMPFTPPLCSSGLGIMGYYALQVSRHKIPDLYGHCMAHCIVKKLCGPGLGDVLSLGIGYGKEWYDKNYGGTGWSEDDIDANERGRTCPPKQRCEERCKIYKR